MDFKKSKKLLTIIAVFYWILVFIIYLVSNYQFKYTLKESNAPTSFDSSTGEIVDGMTIVQNINVPFNTINSIKINAVTYGRNNQGVLHVYITDSKCNEIVYKDIDISTLVDGNYISFDLDESEDFEYGEELTLTITSSGCSNGNAVGIYSGSELVTGRFDIVEDISNQSLYYVNNEARQGMLCIKLAGVKNLDFYKTYWYITISVFILCVIVCLFWWNRAKKGQNNPLVSVCTLYSKYSFLIKKLVSRDFKTKYKRSVLGMAWSFLNPLLTMSVQYIVFSTLFRSDIPNYPVYLLSGIVFFNFFNEAVTMCMTSITSNASLIKKVYIPKYIFPVSRIFSSLINFALSIIPLFLAMVFTGLPFKASLLLLFFDVICLFCFVLGMGLLLTTAMTFFQDTQFLWGIAAMMWNYLTPMFYPESIIPTKFLTIFHMNPMYQYITFARICIIDGVSPEPMSYLWCILSSTVVLMLGIIVFKKNQDKFIMYL